ncbi:sirohydrochlorin chelatase [Macrococcus hajekii]|uniref:Sirohydrochlorin chelatase n=1 Tax=Macrococcus hajekii TaxID=198482 RepID=A0A4R6BLR3_9STAP|nr:sirohydrochlorin chelatase [Macrococcus hajekii]TDM02726.1 sirohydrochlorin chelatase [Macrococcus hajekii]GGB03356.1 cobalamin biosynthesis protein CbiX [Macrococcus hajekii]
MQGIIYIAHGSKMPDKNEKFRQFVDLIIEKRPERIQRLAFLEKDDENVPLVASEMLEAGVTEFLVMPMLLFPAMHAQEDIPEQLESVLGDKASYRVADCFGDEESVWRVALDRIDEARGHVLIVAHGNKRFDEPDMMLTEVVSQMQQRTDKELSAAMLYGKLSFEERLKNLDGEVTIMPYFLFDGHLVRKIKRLSEPFIADGMMIHFTETLDLDDSMAQAVLNKLEALDVSSHA